MAFIFALIIIFASEFDITVTDVVTVATISFMPDYKPSVLQFDIKQEALSFLAKIAYAEGKPDECNNIIDRVDTTTTDDYALNFCYKLRLISEVLALKGKMVLLYAVAFASSCTRTLYYIYCYILH